MLAYSGGIRLWLLCLLNRFIKIVSDISCHSSSITPAAIALSNSARSFSSISAGSRARTAVALRVRIGGRPLQRFGSTLADDYLATGRDKPD